MIKMIKPFKSSTIIPIIVIVAISSMLAALGSGGCQNVTKTAGIQAAARANPNLIANPGFEDGTTDHVDPFPDFWYWDLVGNPVDRHEWIDTMAHTGEKSILIGDDLLGDVTALKTWLIDIDPVNNTYIFSCWYKTSPDFPPYAARAEFCYYKNGTHMHNWHENLERHDEWTFFQMVCNDIPNISDTAPNYIADQVRISLSMERCRGWVAFDDINFRIATPAELTQLAADRYINLPQIPTTGTPPLVSATGKYQLVNTNGSWWMARPDNGRCEMICGMLARRDYSSNNAVHSNFIDSNYTDWEYRQWQYSALKSWNFNSLAVNGENFISHMNYPSDYMATWEYCVDNFSGEQCKDKDGNLAQSVDGVHVFYDPFNTQWRNGVANDIDSKCSARKGDAQFAGYQITNEMYYKDLYRYIYASSSGDEFISVLQNRFGNDVNALNSDWGTSYGSFWDVLTDKPEPVSLTDPKMDDFLAMERHMMAEFANFSLARIKLSQNDPDRPVACNRFDPPNFSEALRWMDVFSGYDYNTLQIYGSLVMLGWNQSELDMCKNTMEATGKPVLISEWDVQGRDTRWTEGLVSFMAKPAVDTQADRGEAYATFYQQMISLPWMLGAQWYKWGDTRIAEPDWCKNEGFVNDHEQPYTELVNRVAQIHDLVRRVDPAFRTWQTQDLCGERVSETGSNGSTSTSTGTGSSTGTGVVAPVLCAYYTGGQAVPCGVQPSPAALLTGIIVFALVRKRMRRNI